MNKVKLVVDSTVDLGVDYYKENDIELVSFDICFDNEIYKDGINIDQDKLFNKIKEKKQIPHTAAVSPIEFSKAFNKWVDQGYDVIFVGIGSMFSSGFQNAVIGAGDYLDKRVFLIDSKSMSIGTGLLVLKIVKYIKEGNKSAKEIKDLVQPLADKIVTQFVVDNLEYLHKGGRCSSVAMLIGNILHIHPYIRVVNNKLIVYKKIRGPIKLAIDEQIKDLKSAMPDIDMDAVMIGSVKMKPEDEKYYHNEIGKILPKDRVKIATVGAIIGTHCGPGTFGILYIKK